MKQWFFSVVVRMLRDWDRKIKVKVWEQVITILNLWLCKMKNDWNIHGDEWMLDYITRLITLLIVSWRLEWMDSVSYLGAKVNWNSVKSLLKKLG